MNWENQGSYWHLDHTIPVSLFDFEDEINLHYCYNWINLRPLRADKNLSKWNKLDFKQYLFQEIKAKYFVKLVNATPSNCGKLLKSYSTTSSEKSFEGTRVMTEPNSNNE